MGTKENNLTLFDNARENPDLIAAVYNNIPLTQEQILQLIDSTQEIFNSENLNENDKVLILLPDSLHLAIVMLALILRKIPFFVLNPKLNTNIHQSFTKLFGATYIVSDSLSSLISIKTIVINKLNIKRNCKLDINSELNFVDTFHKHDFFKFDKKVGAITKVTYQNYFSDLTQGFIDSDDSSRFLIAPINYGINFKLNFLSLMYGHLVIYPSLGTNKKNIFFNLFKYGITDWIISEKIANSLARANVKLGNGLLLGSLKKLIIVTANTINPNDLEIIEKKFTSNIFIQKF